jgi:hypothetical protein
MQSRRLGRTGSHLPPQGFGGVLLGELHEKIEERRAAGYWPIVWQLGYTSSVLKQILCGMSGNDDSKTSKQWHIFCCEFAVRQRQNFTQRVLVPTVQDKGDFRSAYEQAQGESGEGGWQRSIAEKPAIWAEDIGDAKRHDFYRQR